VPDFVVVGVPRAGTTSLYHYVSQHPALDPSPIKEINFLAYPGAARAAAETPWLQFPVTSAASYEALFDPRRIGVDFSVSCFHSDVAIANIQRHVPEAGIVIVLRDPVKRAWSAYLNRIKKGYERRSPHEALQPGEWAVERSLYLDRVRRYRDAFGDRVSIWLFDDFAADPTTAVRALFAHFGVDPDVPVETSRVYNQASVPKRSLSRVLPTYRVRRQVANHLPGPALAVASRVWQTTQAVAPALPPEVASSLRRYFAADVRAVGELVDRDLGRWLPTS
jgi:hypothetical protein